MTLFELRESLLHGTIDSTNAFSLLKEVGRYVSSTPHEPATQDLVILALHRREDLGIPFREIVDALASALGLYPYVVPADLPASDLLAYEFSRPLNLEEVDIVFHRVQSEVYRYLLQGESVILSAPTSFGKSLLIDAVIASQRYRNIAVIVPTIALIDETRRRLGHFRTIYRIITHANQVLGERNVFVLTQERVLDFPNLPRIDFFVIDEFYKLAMEQDSSRASLLNLAFYRLNKRARAFYMLGPNIENLTANTEGRINARWIKTDYRTVATEIVEVPKSQRTLNGLAALCSTLDEQSLIYCKSPNSARMIGKALSARLGASQNKEVTDAVAWLSQHYPNTWSYIECLRNGIGLHHGRIPRALLQMSVRLFNQGHIRFLVCTSTLIEGVNTSAKNVIIYDKLIGTRNYDYFTYCNIRGRAGRMRKHFVGRVYNFIDAPQAELPVVDFPVVSQPSNLPLQVVVEMDKEDLTEESQSRVSELEKQIYLPMAIIKANLGMEPDAQVSLARRLRKLTTLELRDLAWTGFPTTAQLNNLCTLLWSAFFAGGGMVAGVSSGIQLATKLNLARINGFQRWLRSELARGQDADTAVEEILDFYRQWCGFHFPRAARAVESIVRHEQMRRALPLGNYSVFIGQAEAGFMPPVISVLDEYGIPIQISQRLHADSNLPDDLDVALDRVRADARRSGYLSDFERNLIIAALGDQ